MSKKKSHEALVIDQRPLGLPRAVWIVLTVMDLFLFVVGALAGRLDLSLGALVLILIIEHYAHDLLVGPYERRQERVRQQYGIKGRLTPAQSREVFKEYRRERKERCAQRRAVKSQAKTMSVSRDGVE
ncbi:MULTISPECIES: hypothetical protein [Coriobacteriia]|uniref:hypothetical protein n=1 Tax=Coriobacteriia TaxID=84998 RepID=UPI00272C3588|nr:hypothetical protein [Adlercreutzia caecimuris]